LRSPAGTRWSTAWEPYNVASAIPTAMAVRSRLQRNELCDEKERSSRRRSPRTLVLPLGHSTRFAVDRFLQESRTAPALHRIDLKSAKRRDDRDRIVGIGKYFVTYGGEVIGEFSCPECDVARWLLARGLAGEGDTLVAFWNDGQPGLTGNVGWLAGKGTVSGKTRLRRLPGTMGHQKPRLPSSRRGGQSRRRGIRHGEARALGMDRNEAARGGSFGTFEIDCRGWGPLVLDRLGPST
jgi:hypothetical protein